MTRIIIICEGPTEQEFCNKMLAPYFATFDIYIEAPRIKHSHGGIVPWHFLYRQIDTHLRSDKNAYVTTLIDFYGISDKLGFPGWEDSKYYLDVVKRVERIEEEMKNCVEDTLRTRFLPYIQLHEFEGLLFCNADVFDRIIPQGDLVGAEELGRTLAEYDNPELINSSRETSPSHRLERIIRGYDKVVYGNYLAESIGLATIRQRCPRFNNWIEGLCLCKD